MKVLVTGGAGYIGSVLTGSLLKSGHDVTVLDNYYYGQNSLLEYCSNDKFNLVRGDCRDDATVKKLLVDTDVVIPLAAIVGASACDNDRTAARSVNVDAIKIIVNNTSNNQLIVYPNTNSGYGIGQKGIHCTEDTPLNPISLYGKTKVEGEGIIMDTGRGITLRLATVFGASPRMRMDLLVNDFVYRAINDKFVVLYEWNFMRNYIHVRDVAKGFIHCINNAEMMKGQVYNLGLSDANYSKKDLCDEIKRFIPEFHYFTSDYNKDVDKRDYVISNEKVERTGFKTDYQIDRGIIELIKAYKIINNYNHTNL
jgi:nucleoside-diphosphate-sugar epimerase